MSIVNSVVKNGIEYTKNGCRLIPKTSKVVDVPVGVAASTKMHLDTIVIETDFGKAIKTIESMRVPDGKPVQKVITETREGEVVEKIVRDYTYDRSIKIVKTSKTGRGGINLGESEEIINWFGHDVTDTGINRITTRIKFDKQFGGGGERLEHQLYETIEHGKGRTKHLETYAKRLADGHIVDTHIKGSGVNLDSLANDPYLFIRNYDKKDFANSARWIAEKDQKISGYSGAFVIAPIKGYNGFYREFDSAVFVDVSKPLLTNTDLVNIINHEYRHKYQSKKGSQFIQRFLNIFRSKENNVPINESLTYAVKNRFAHIIYPFTTFFHKGYWNNFNEVDARQAGKVASTLYETYSEILANVFGGPRRMYHFQDDPLRLTIQDAIANNKVFNAPAMDVGLFRK